MEENFEQHFQGFEGLDEYCPNISTADVPLSNDFLDGFGMEPYEATAHGFLLSPNSFDFKPSSVQQSPLFPSMSPLVGEFDFQQSDGSSDADDYLRHQLLLQLHESHTNTESDSCNNHLSINSNNSKPHRPQGEPSITSSSDTNAAAHHSFVTPPEGSHCVRFPSTATTSPSDCSAGQSALKDTPKSTHVPVTPKVANNTSSVSAPCVSQHSPTSKPQHFIQNPSHLRHQTHLEVSQHSPFTAPATEDHTTGQLLHTMSSNSNSINGRELNASPSHNSQPNIHRFSNRPQFHRITSAENQIRRSPVLQNYQPFHESSLRTSGIPDLGQDYLEAEQFQIPQYPDPKTTFQWQFDNPPYMGHHHVNGYQGNYMKSYSHEQHMQSSDSRNASLISQGSTDFGLDWSSPTCMKRELSSPDSDYWVSTPRLESQMGSPKPQKTRRAKQELKKSDEKEGAVDPAALQTSDLTNLDTTDRLNIATLINAMHNTDDVEDNKGMQKTWEKVRKAKAFRIKEVCVDLLNLSKQAQQQKGTPLGEKRPAIQYASFEERFDTLRQTLKSQKTVCKHLIELPYSYSVVDDPHYAAERVRNNRRVNHQKAEAIRLGREHLGETGQGKGKPIKKTKKRKQTQLEDSQDEEENSGDEPPSDAETDVPRPMLGRKSARQNHRAPKRAKRSTESIRHHPHKSAVQASYSPQVQTSENLGLHQNACSPGLRAQLLSAHGRMPPRQLTSSPQMPTLNQGYDFQPRNQPGNIRFEQY